MEKIKKHKRWLYFSGLIILLIQAPDISVAQYHHDGDDHNWMWDDSRERIELQGKVIIDSNQSYPLYYLDTNNDELSDYQLSFGPWWYEPGNGAKRPENNEIVSIEGVTHNVGDPPVVMVFIINGLEWRKESEGGMMGWEGNHMWVDSLQDIEVSGTAMVDTTYYNNHYYIDTDYDNSPDYMLGFGPHWYVPASGAQRPSNGDIINISGGLYSNHLEFSSIMVYSINGLVWRDSTGPHPWSGSWVHKDASDSTYIYCLSDSLSWMIHAPGSMMGGMMFPDSVFCQFEEIFTGFAPGENDSTLIASYYMNMFNPVGQGMMDQGSPGMMRFNRETEFRFHYDDKILDSLGNRNESLKIKFWDTTADQWNEVISFTVDTVDNIISFDNDEMYSYYGIFAAGKTLSSFGSIISKSESNIEEFKCYPNPFSSQTNISFTLLENQLIKMNVYDIRGRNVKTLINKTLPAGKHNLSWNGEGDLMDIGPGNYFITIQSRDEARTLKISLTR